MSTVILEKGKLVLGPMGPIYTPSNSLVLVGETRPWTGGSGPTPGETGPR